MTETFVPALLIWFALLLAALEMIPKSLEAVLDSRPWAAIFWAVGALVWAGYFISFTIEQLQ